MQATLTPAAALSTYFADPAPASAADRSSAVSAAGVASGVAVDSSALLQGNKAVAISHNGSLYRLQATKLGKLILTK
jgi:hemin uptake protein HemP